MKNPKSKKLKNDDSRTFIHYEKTIKMTKQQSMGIFFSELYKYENELKEKIKITPKLSFELYARETEKKDGFIFSYSIVPKIKNKLFKNGKRTASVLM